MTKDTVTPGGSGSAHEDIRKAKAGPSFVSALACLPFLLAACVPEEAPLSLPLGEGFEDEPRVIGSITSDNTVLLARSSLEMTSRLIVLGNIATAMLREHAGLLSGPEFGASDIAQCAGSPDGYDFETNRVSHRRFAPGFALPAGPALRVSLSNCAIEGVLISGFIDITAIALSGDPGGPGDWSAQAVIASSPVEILHANGTATSITDQMRYTAGMTGGVLTTTLEVSADADAGMIGGLNAQHYAAPLNASSPTVNYQFRPFRIQTVEGPGSGPYSVTIGAHTEGASTLHRYTNNGDPGISLRIATTGAPIVWQEGRPTRYTDAPASGEIRLQDGCSSGCGSILVTVTGPSVSLIVEADGGVTTQSGDWGTLLSPPAAP